MIDRFLFLAAALPLLVLLGMLVRDIRRPPRALRWLHTYLMWRNRGCSALEAIKNTDRQMARRGS